MLAIKLLAGVALRGNCEEFAAHRQQSTRREHSVLALKRNSDIDIRWSSGPTKGTNAPIFPYFLGLKTPDMNSVLFLVLHLLHLYLSVHLVRYSPAGRSRRRACPSPGRYAVRCRWTSSRTQLRPSRHTFYVQNNSHNHSRNYCYWGLEAKVLSGPFSVSTIGWVCEWTSVAFSCSRIGQNGEWNWGYSQTFTLQALWKRMLVNSYQKTP